MRLWHLTTKKDWRLDPTYHPAWAYWGTGGPHKVPGIFVTDRPRYWEPFMGVGPIWAVRIEAPKEILKSPGKPGFVWPHPEYLIEALDQVKVLEVIPLEEAILRGQEEERAGIWWDKQEYGGFGGVEDWWYVTWEEWDDRKKQTVLKRRARKGLERLMEEWRRKTGYKNPLERYADEERARKGAP